MATYVVVQRGTALIGCAEGVLNPYVKLACRGISLNVATRTGCADAHRVAKGGHERGVHGR